MDISNILQLISDYIWSLPFLLFFFGVCIFMTIYLNFVQFFYFTQSIKMLLIPNKSSNDSETTEKLSPFQAFMNTLGGNIGNGSLAGIPVAITIGGPGSVFWLLLMSTFSVSLRFSEVFLATYFSRFATKEKSGPMYYLSLLPMGNLFSFLFCLFAFGFMITGGCLIQCNAVSTAINRSWNIDQNISAIIVSLFVLYVLVGGATRIVKFLDALVPIKVYGFLISALIVLIYHIQSIPHALYLIVSLAFQPQALLGGSFAFAIQKSIALGLQQGITATEAGLGTSAIAFGTTTNQNPISTGIMSMLSVYINTHLICFLVALCVISSGVWNNGETSSALLISAYETVFGPMAGFIVSILITMFATSVVIAFAYNAKICWNYLFNGKFTTLFIVLYTLCASYGTIMNAKIVWTINSIVTGGLFSFNVFGILYFAKTIKNELLKYKNIYE